MIAAPRYSYALPVWKLILLSVLTFGVYEFYWFYRNWKHFRDHKGWDVSPGWRTVGLLVPILDIVLAYIQLRDIRDAIETDGMHDAYSPGWVIFGWIVLGALWRLPDPFWALSILSVLPLAMVQGPLNDYWKRQHPDARVKTGLSGAQIALIVVGVVLWGLILMGIVLPEAPTV